MINNPTRFDPANGKDNRQALLERYTYVLDGMAETGTRRGGGGRAGAKRLPKFPKIEAESAYAGQKGFMLDMVKKELLRLGFTEEEINGGGLRVYTTFSKRAMTAAEEGVAEQKPKGKKDLHVARGQRPAGHRRAARLLRRPGLPRVPDQLGHQRRLARLVVQAVRAGGGHRRGLLPQGHLPGQLALRVPRR